MDYKIKRLPFRYPGRYQVWQTWGGSFSHTGHLYCSVDFNLKVGHCVVAVEDGTVVEMENDMTDAPPGTVDTSGSGNHIKGTSGIGNFVTLEHTVGTETFYTTYCHFQRGSIPLSKGSFVRAGQVLGIIGRTGYLKGVHLHFHAGTDDISFTQGVVANASKANSIDYGELMVSSTKDGDLTTEPSRYPQLQKFYQGSTFRTFVPPLDVKTSNLADLYATSESKTKNYYPITAHGWWHNGVHLPAKPHSGVRAMADGRVIYARIGRPKDVKTGSNNFILLKHQMKEKKKYLTFYSLYMHLEPLILPDAIDDDGATTKIPDWVKRTFYRPSDSILAGDEGTITGVYPDGSVSLFLDGEGKQASTTGLHMRDKFTVLSPPSGKTLKVKYGDKEGWIYHQGKIKIDVPRKLYPWATDGTAGKPSSEFFSHDKPYSNPVSVIAGEVIGNVGQGLETVAVRDHKSLQQKVSHLLHFEVFSRRGDNDGKDLYELLDVKDHSYFKLKDLDDDVVAEPDREKTSILGNLDRDMKEFAPYLRKKFPKALQEMDGIAYWKKTIFKDREVEAYMERYKVGFRDCVALHISTWQALKNKLTYTLWRKSEAPEMLKPFQLFNEKILESNEKLFFYNPIRFIELMQKAANKDEEN